jgi:hypothetical protein
VPTRGGLISDVMRRRQTGKFLFNAWANPAKTGSKLSGS